MNIHLWANLAKMMFIPQILGHDIEMNKHKTVSSHNLNSNKFASIQCVEKQFSSINEVLHTFSSTWTAQPYIRMVDLTRRCSAQFTVIRSFQLKCKLLGSHFPSIGYFDTTTTQEEETLEDSYQTEDGWCTCFVQGAHMMTGETGTIFSVTTNGYTKVYEMKCIE